MMDIAGEMVIGSRGSDTETPFLNDIDVGRDNLLGGSTAADAIVSLDSRTLNQDWGNDADDTLSTSPPSSASASILSMPDPLSSSNTTSQYDTIRGADYPGIIDSESGVSSPALNARNPPGNKPLVRSQERQHAPLPREHEPRTNLDHFDHDHDHDHGYGSDSEVESESSFPSVTSSFFFSSPASVASHGPGDDSNEEDGGDSESSRGISRGLRATQELIIPSLILPEALVNRPYSPLETPHASQLQSVEPPSQHPLDLNAIRLLVVTPSDLRRVGAVGVDITLVSERVKTELEEMSRNAFERGGSAELCLVIPRGHDVDSVLTTVINSFSQNELFTAVVVVSEIGDVPNEMTEALSSIMPIINLNIGSSSPQPSSSATFAVSSVQGLHNLLIQRQVSQQLRTEAVEKYTTWASHRRDGEGTTQLKAIQSIVDRRAARPRREHGRPGSGSDPAPLARSKADPVTMSSNRLQSNQSHEFSGRAVIDSEGSWREFKTQWKTSLEDMYSSRQENLSREVTLKLRHVAADDSAVVETTSEEENQLRTARLPYTAPSTAGALKIRRLSRPKKVQRSSSSSPIPATSPSLPATSSTLSTMPSFVSLSESLFVSTDELPDTPLLPPVPLTVGFPFPSFSRTSPLYTLSDHSSRSRSSTRDRAHGSGKRNGASGGRGSRSPLRIPYPYDSPSPTTPFILDLHASRFDPLHLPSFIALSFSLLAPLRAHMWSAVRRVATRRFRALESRTSEEESSRSGMFYMNSISGEQQEEKGGRRDDDSKLENSFDSINSFGVRGSFAAGDSDQNDDDEPPSSPSSSSAYLSRLGRIIWPTGVMLVGGFLLGFVVGHLNGL
ncbi:hypothetical protein D9757_005850 [Collybiopsis confluens]|uniref:Uncharacterized protein n=1 Tax=Collybiopsis confluens TaxID=2823264 RepID=A0A8H5HN31_9AGAR|nr:hypothetical protein D9757_005850 [Collybiopsis confluens]